MKKKIFISAGTQRSGSTFLSKIFNSLDCCNPPIIKEMHIWNAVENKLFDDRLFNDLNINTYNGVSIDSLKVFKQEKYKQYLEQYKYIRKIMYKLQNNLEEYFNYFESLLSKNGKSITYDLTPQYICLEKETIKRIYDQFKKKNIECKFILSIRDPVERNWSAVKKAFKKRKTIQLAKAYQKDSLTDGVNTKLSLEDSFFKYSRSEYAKILSNYQFIYNNLNSCLEKNSFLILIHEEINMNIYKKKIEDYVGLNLDHLNFKEKINPSAEINLSNKIYLQNAKLYNEIYDFCGVQFPEVKKYWRFYNQL